MRWPDPVTFLKIGLCDAHKSRKLLCTLYLQPMALQVAKDPPAASGKREFSSCDHRRRNVAPEQSSVVHKQRVKILLRRQKMVHMRNCLINQPLEPLLPQFLDRKS